MLSLTLSSRGEGTTLKDCVTVNASFVKDESLIQQFVNLSNKFHSVERLSNVSHDVIFKLTR